MRRYLPLFSIAVFLIVAVFSSASYLAEYSGSQKPEYLRTINLYTTLPTDQVSVLANEFEKKTNIGINIITLSDNDLQLRAKNASLVNADVILADRAVLINVKKANLLASYTSEPIDIIPDKFKDAGNCWTGVWYDPVVFVVNRDYWQNNSNIPLKWSDIPRNRQLRIGITDFLATKAFSNLFFSMIASTGETKTIEYLKSLHPQIAKYSQFLSTPVRMCSLAEVDFSIVVHSEAMRYAYDEFPLRIIYPQDGSAYLLTGAGLVKNSPNPAEAKQFINWLTQDNAQTILSTNHMYFIPTNPDAKMYKSFGAQNIKLFENQPEFSFAQQHKMLDNWVQTVRLNSN